MSPFRYYEYHLRGQHYSGYNKSTSPDIQRFLLRCIQLFSPRVVRGDEHQIIGAGAVKKHVEAVFQDEFYRWSWKLAELGGPLPQNQSTSTTKVLPGRIPPGWYVAPPHDLTTILEGWPGPEYKLPEPYKPLLFSEGEVKVLIQYGHDNYCIWNEVSDDIFRIEEPKDLRSVLERLGDPMGKSSGARIRFQLLEYPG